MSSTLDTARWDRILKPSKYSAPDTAQSDDNRWDAILKPSKAKQAPGFFERFVKRPYEQANAPIDVAMKNLLIEPVLNIFGPQAPLTDRLFGGTENVATRAVDVAIKTAPFWVGIGTGTLAARGISALAPKLVGTLGAEMTVGGISGAAGSAAAAAAQEQPAIPAAAMGGVLGIGLGAGVWKLAQPGRRLAAAYAARPGAGQFPDIADLDASIPHVSIVKREAEARAEAARRAFRRHIPRGAAHEDIRLAQPALWERAKADARRGAAMAGRAIDDVELEGDAINRFMEMGQRIQNAALRTGTMESARNLWRIYVTRLGTTLTKDPMFGSQGARFADAITRIEELADPMEGRLHTLINDLWRGVPKSRGEAITAFLRGEGGRLSAEEMAIAQRWREMADKGFDQLSTHGVRELVSEGHPSLGGELFPEIPSASGGKRLMVPIQKRTNYVPEYRDPRELSRLTKNTPQRAAFLRKLVEDGEADNLLEAAVKLDELLGFETGTIGRKFVPLEISTAMQHERAMSIGLPFERNAYKWMSRWAHDVSRRVARARVVGGQDQQVNTMISALREEVGDAAAKRVERIWRNLIGRPPLEAVRAAPLARGVRALTAIQLLSPRVGILQALQLANPAARLGIRHTLSAVVALWRNPSLRGAAEEIGALLPSQHLLTAAEAEPMAKAGRWWVENVTFMPRGDRMVRVPSAVSGMVAAKEWAKEYWRLSQTDAAAGAGTLSTFAKAFGVRNRAARMEILRRRLEDTLGIPMQHVLETGGELPIETVLAAGRAASHNTQFANSILDMPEARRTGWGQFLFILKSYSKQQSTFVTQMAKDAMKGDTGPLVRFLLIYPPLYAVAKPYLDLLGARDMVDAADQETLERVEEVLQGAVTTGMFGAMGDFINQMGQSDVGRATGYLLGPGISQGIGLTVDAATAAQGNFGPLIKRLTPRALRPVLARIGE